MTSQSSKPLRTDLIQAALSKAAVALFSVTLVVGCGSSKAYVDPPNQAGLQIEDRIQSSYSDLVRSGVSVSFNGQLIADLSQVSPVTSAYGTVTQGTTLNLLNNGQLEFLIYGNDGVFAAECEASATDASFGPTHPLCQTAHAENYDTLIVCYANSEDADLMTAQAWPGSSSAFEAGKGMICYQDGVKMLSTHIFTY